MALSSALFLASADALPASASQQNQGAPTSQAAKPAKATTPGKTSSASHDAGPSAMGAPTRYSPKPISRRAELHYDLIWGVSDLTVKAAESNEMIRFSYRVLDPAKAKTLNDEKNAPSLIDPKAGVQLVIPSLEKVGKLRQVSAPEAGKMYWMAFSNKGRLVKPGDRINIVIGNFHADGLVVE